MSYFQHRICVACWNARNQDNQVPDDRFGDTFGACCFCGMVKRGLTFVRYQGNTLLCQGRCDA